MVNWEVVWNVTAKVPILTSQITQASRNSPLFYDFRDLQVYRTFLSWMTGKPRRRECLKSWPISFKRAE
jgi:citrate synthase